MASTTRVQADRQSDYVNLGQTERLLTAAAGAGLIVAGLRGGSWKLPTFGLIGAALLRRGLSGHCELYDWLDINTTHGTRRTGIAARHGVKIEKSVRIDVYPTEVYRFWRKLENLPRFFRHLESVQPLDDRRSNWQAKALLGSTVQWDAEIINDRENELIAWQSLPGSDVETAGSVHFERTPDGAGTLVHVSLKYNPSGGRLGIALAELIGQDADSKIEADLRELKQLLETGIQTAPLAGGLGPTSTAPAT